MPSEPIPSSIHRIRLRGPWEFLWISPPAALSPAARKGSIQLPAAWRAAFGELGGTVRLSRAFNRPSGLENGERVWLDVSAADETSISLNGAWLGRSAGGTARFDVTDRLDLHCRVDLELSGSPDEERALPEVSLVMEAPA
jgi:hypothetical protein